MWKHTEVFAKHTELGSNVGCGALLQVIPESIGQQCDWLCLWIYRRQQRFSIAVIPRLRLDLAFPCACPPHSPSWLVLKCHWLVLKGNTFLAPLTPAWPAKGLPTHFDMFFLCVYVCLFAFDGGILKISSALKTFANHSRVNLFYLFFCQRLATVPIPIACVQTGIDYSTYGNLWLSSSENVTKGRDISAHRAVNEFIFPLP